MSPDKSVISVNGRDYRWPDKPVVVVCIDGSEPDYIEQAIAAGVMPWMKKVSRIRAPICAYIAWYRVSPIRTIFQSSPVYHRWCTASAATFITTRPMTVK